MASELRQIRRRAQQRFFPHTQTLSLFEVVPQARPEQRIKGLVAGPGVVQLLETHRVQ